MENIIDTYYDRIMNAIISMIVILFTARLFIEGYLPLSDLIPFLNACFLTAAVGISLNHIVPILDNNKIERLKKENEQG